MEQSFFMDDFMLCHTSCGDCSSVDFWSSWGLGPLCINPFVSFAPFYLYQDRRLQGDAKGVFQGSCNRGIRINGFDKSHFKKGG
jgi:hypothetical protein